MKILIVDDEPDVLEFMQYNLEKEGYFVQTAPNGMKALEIAQKIVPNLIILDVMMPTMDGIQTCKALRAMPLFKKTLILFLTAKSDDISQIEGLDSGADDFINKPIKPKLLLSRIQALLRRVNTPELATISHKNIVLNREKYRISQDEKERILPKKEFELLALLMSKPGKVFTREEILENVWGTETIVGDRTIDVHIRKLREKIGDPYFTTIKGIGYKFEE